MNVKLVAAGFATALIAGGGLSCLLLQDSDADTTPLTSPNSPTTTLSLSLLVPEAPADVSRASGARTLPQQVVAADEAAVKTAKAAQSSEASDALFEELSRADELPQARLREALRAAFRFADDWELQELAFAVERRIDPVGHRAHVLELSRAPSSPVGSLVGALKSLEELDAKTQDTFLAELSRSQSRALTTVEGLEATQRRDLVDGAVAALVKRVTPFRRVEWLLESTGVERLTLADRLDEEGLLTGPQGLSLPETRKLVAALVRDAERHTDLAGWGAELMLLARLQREALDSPALQATLRKGLESKNAAVQETARVLLGQGS